MTSSDATAAYRDRLKAMRQELLDLSEAAAASRKPVELDQSSIGRLSRQDALQQQAMAKAQDMRRAMEINRINSALARIDSGAFGWCADCGEAIAAGRLNINPYTSLCSTCAAGD